jgi:hypothetical protein
MRKPGFRLKLGVAEFGYGFWVGAFGKRPLLLTLQSAIHIIIQQRRNWITPSSGTFAQPPGAFLAANADRHNWSQHPDFRNYPG